MQTTEGEHIVMVQPTSIGPSVRGGGAMGVALQLFHVGAVQRVCEVNFAQIFSPPTPVVNGRSLK